MKNKKTKIKYGNAVNLSGLWSNIPLKLIKDKETKEYRSEDGEFVWIEGYESGPGCIKYVSKNYYEVEVWTQGVLDTMEMLSSWSSMHQKDRPLEEDV